MEEKDHIGTHKVIEGRGGVKVRILKEPSKEYKAKLKKRAEQEKKSREKQEKLEREEKLIRDEMKEMARENLKRKGLL